jgi:TfoX/Sxy family transcriptional regulator of competence genes
MPRHTAQHPPTEASGDEQLVERVRAALTGVPKVKEKRMFGSTGFMVRGNLCVTARPTRIMCRIDPSTHSAAIKREGVQTVIMKGRTYQGYVYVDASALKTERALKYWVGQALEFNRTLHETAK